MPLTLKNYTKELTKDLLQAAEKCKVRECDETDKGVFVAYVDEGNDTFDVSVTLAGNGEVKASSCDCGNAVFCKHRAALLAYLAKDKKPAPAIKISKKENPLDALLNQADVDDLKDWVRTLVQKNKDIELSFLNYFSAKKQSYTPAEVIALVANAVKAAGCNKKSADASQIKKLVELWALVLAPVEQYYQAGVVDEQAFNSFHAMLEHCLQVYNTVATSSNRVIKFVQDTLRRSVAAVNQVQQKDAWLRAAGYFVNKIHDERYGAKMHYIVHLNDILEVADEAKRNELIMVMMAQFKKLSAKDIANQGEYTKAMFAMVSRYSLAAPYCAQFTPIRFENDFNVNLIALLIKSDQARLAKKYCKEQIAGNYREEYNVPYLYFLKDIYAAENDETNLAGVLQQLFTYTFDFDAYLYITARMNEADRKQWRTKVLTKARQAANRYNYGAMAFCFKLMNEEQNYRKMIDYINSATPYALIAEYFEQMAAADKNRLLQEIIRKSDSDWLYYATKKREDGSSFPALFEMVKKHYTVDYLTMVMKQQNKQKSYYHRLNDFLIYMNEQLGLA